MCCGRRGGRLAPPHCIQLSDQPLHLLIERLRSGKVLLPDRRLDALVELVHTPPELVGSRGFPRGGRRELRDLRPPMRAGAVFVPDS